MSLILSPIQNFPVESHLVLLPLNSGWDLKLLTNSGTPIFDFMKNSPQSGSFTYSLKPKSSYNSYVLQGYSDLKIRTSVEIPNNDPNWLAVVSDWYPVANYTNANNNSYKDVTILISPTLTISQGVHNGKVKFHIEGKKNNIVEVLSTYEIPVVLNVFEEGLFYSPIDFTFYYNPNNYVSQNLKISGNNWKVTAPLGIRLDGPGVVINANNQYEATGSGMKTLQVTLHPSITFVLDDDPSIVLPFVVEFESGTYTIPITVIHAGNFYPENIVFQIQSGVLNVPFHLINLTRTEDYSVTLPASFGYEKLSTSSGKKLKITILDPTSFGSGVYWIDINIIYPDATYTVKATVWVGNQFDLGIDTTSAIFTHSMNDLNFKSSNQNSYIDLILNVIGYSNGINYQFPFFKGSAAKNIGKTLANFISYDLSSGLEGSYPLNYFDLNVNEKIKQATVLNYSKSNIAFLLGYKPEVKGNRGILVHNKQTRFTKKSFALVSVFALNGNFEYELLKNSQVVQSVPSMFGYIKTIKINFEQFDATDGDVFDFVLKTSEGNISYQMIIFPEVQQSIDIVYINSFGIHSNFNFTGNTLDVFTELNNKIELYHNKSFLNTRKFLEKETSTLNLNTGYILKSQFVDVLELVKSSKAWVVKNNEKVLELVPKSQEVLEVSADNYLNSYNVEFEINKEKYAQDYNF